MNKEELKQVGEIVQHKIMKGKFIITERYANYLEKMANDKESKSNETK